MLSSSAAAGAAAAASAASSKPPRSRLVDPKLIVASATLRADGQPKLLGEPPKPIYHPEFKFYMEGKGLFKGKPYVYCTIDGTKITAEWHKAAQHIPRGPHIKALRIWESHPGAEPEAERGEPDVYANMVKVAALAETHNINSAKLLSAMREDKEFRYALRDLDHFPHHKVVTDAVCDTAEEVMKKVGKDVSDGRPIGAGSDESFILGGKVRVHLCVCCCGV